MDNLLPIFAISIDYLLLNSKYDKGELLCQQEKYLIKKI